MSRSVSGRRRASLRAATVAGLVAASTFGLAACRTIDPAADKAKKAAEEAAKHPVVASTPTMAAPTPTPSPTPVAPVTTTPIEPVATSPSPTPTPAPTTTVIPTDATSPNAEPSTSSVNTKTGQPRKVVVSDPWQLVGQPYLLDNDSPNDLVAGKTTYTLFFRTRGDFRGVRAGTPITDPRHYKIGDVTLSALPGLIRTGQGNLRLGDRRRHPERYCWSGIVNVRGGGTSTRFATHTANTTIPVEFNLHGAPTQTKSAIFVVRAGSTALQPAQTALGCH